MCVVVGQMIDHAGQPGMDLAAAQILGGNLLAGRGFDERRPGEEDRTLVANDDRFVRHCWNIGPASGATSHDNCNLANALRAHVRLIEEDAAEMLAVGKDLVLARQIGPAAVDEVDTRQFVLECDLLRPQVFLDRQRIIGTTLHGRVVRNDNAQFSSDLANSGNHSGCRNVIIVNAVSRQLPNLKERRSRIE